MYLKTVFIIKTALQKESFSSIPKLPKPPKTKSTTLTARQATVSVLQLLTAQSMISLALWTKATVLTIWLILSIISKEKMMENENWEYKITGQKGSLPRIIFIGIIAVFMAVLAIDQFKSAENKSLPLALIFTFMAIVPLCLLVYIVNRTFFFKILKMVALPNIKTG